MSTIEEKFDLLKSEVDALQVAVTSQNTPWYRSIPIWVSIAALLFSFGTTLVSFKRTEVQDIQNTKSELRNILQRLAVLPTTQFELSEKYKCDKNAIGFISSQINQESTLLAKQAAYLAESLPQDVLSSAEYASIAFSLQNSYQIDDAERYYELAKNTAESVNDEVTALRGLGGLKLLSGQIEQGRSGFLKALDIFSKYPGHNDYTITSAHVYTYLMWSNTEANIGQLDLANQKLEEAQQLVKMLVQSPGKALLEGQINETKQKFNNPNNSKNLDDKNCSALKESHLRSVGPM